MTAALKVQSPLLSNPQTSLVTGAGPGGEGEPSGFGRRQHDWTDWSEVVDAGVDDDLSERVCVTCGAEQIVSTECLLPTYLLRRGAALAQGEAA